MKNEIVAFAKKYKIQLGILLFFVIWMSFFDEYNWIRIQRDKAKLENLKEEREYLIEKINKDRKQLHTLQSDSEALEKFAREQYLLKKENEEVYIIQESN
ncbi:MAG: septum formation initiator family protein [Prolixibacteraceae bacterium]